MYQLQKQVGQHTEYFFKDRMFTRLPALFLSSRSFLFLDYAHPKRRKQQKRRKRNPEEEEERRVRMERSLACCDIMLLRFCNSYAKHLFLKVWSNFQSYFEQMAGKNRPFSLVLLDGVEVVVRFGKREAKPCFMQRQLELD